MKDRSVDNWASEWAKPAVPDAATGGIVGLAHRWARAASRSALVGVALVSIGIGVAQTSLAAPFPPIVNKFNPWSWPSFKQTYGGSLSSAFAGNDFILGAPSTPTIAFGTAQGTGATPGTNPPWLFGSQVPGFEIGDFFDPSAISEPPDGKNTFRDTGQVLWASPSQYIGSGSGSLSTVTVDDSDGGFTTTFPAGFPWTSHTGIVGANKNTYTSYSPEALRSFGPATATAAWTTILPYSGSWSVYVFLPPAQTGEHRIPDAKYVITNGSFTKTITVDQSVTFGQWALIDSEEPLDSTTPVTITLDNSTDATALSPYTIVADAVQFRPDGLTVNAATTNTVNFNAGTGWSQVAAINLASPPNLGLDRLSDVYYRQAPTPTSGTETQVRWTPTVPAAGLYSVYAWFPSAVNLTTSTTQAEGHVPDARYIVHVGGSTVLTANVSQINGGRWVLVGGPVYFPEGTGSYVTVDNFSTSGGDFVVADAIQLRQGGEGTASFGSPSAINITDYPEVSAGYSPNTTLELGGLPAAYKAPRVVNKLQDATNIDTISGSAAPDTTAHTQPLNQLVYFARTESILTAGGGVASGGAVYCVDGMTGNVVWRYPSAGVSALEIPSSIAAAPLVVRNMLVRVDKPVTGAQFAGNTYRLRTVVIVGDNNGKLFCLDAAGNQDGDDTVQDASGTAISFDLQGNPVGAGAGPLTVRAVGTTSCYWVWQPDASHPINPLYFDVTCDNDPGNNNPTTDPRTGGTYSSTGWDVEPTVVGSSDAFDGTYERTAPKLPVDPVKTATWTITTPTFVGGGVHSYNVYAYHPSPIAGVEDHVSDASYQVVGTTTISANIDQTTSARWDLIGVVDATSGQPVTVTLTNVSGASGATTFVVADAVRIQDLTADKDVDSLSDLIVPGPFQTNSVTCALAAFNTGLTSPLPAVGFKATLFVGNSNGVVYSLDGSGVLVNPAIGLPTPVNSPPFTPQDPGIFDASVDPSFPTIRVNWWFNTGGGIAYAPVFSPTVNPMLPTSTSTTERPSQVYVTTYAPDDTNKGVLFAINADTGPVSNFGLGYDETKTTPLSAPGSNLYNVRQVPRWSFPDQYGTVRDLQKNPLPLYYHVITSKRSAINGNIPPALPLGDIAGSPTIFTDVNLASTAKTRIYIAANDPESDLNGRIMSVSEQGQFLWSYPATNGVLDPNKVGDTNSQIGDTSGNPGVFTPVRDSNGDAITIGSFTKHLDAPNYFVSSSPTVGWITFPAALPANQSDLAHATVPMLYVGALDGFLYAFDVADATTPRLIYNFPVSDTSPIYSTPLLISGSSTGAGGVPLVGGVVFVNNASGELNEIEATPYVFGGITYVNTDVDFSGTGSLSSPVAAGFNITNLEQTAVSPDPTLINIKTDVNEWIYVGTDAGPVLGFTPNVVLGSGNNGGNNGTIGIDTLVPAQPPTITGVYGTRVDLTRNLITAVSAVRDDNDFNSSANYSPMKTGTTGTNPNPVFEWGQTVYIKVFGLDNPAGTGLTTAGVPDPRTLSVTFTVQTMGAGGRVTHIESQTISPANITAITGSWPPSALASGTTTASQIGHFVGTFPYTLGNGDGQQQTPGTKVKLTNVTETYLIDNTVKTTKGRVDTGTVIDPTAGQVTAPVDQATFGILNPLAVRGAGKILGGTGMYNIALKPYTNAALTGTYECIGPFQSFDEPEPAFADYMFAASNGNAIPDKAPTAGSITTASGGIIDVTTAATTQLKSPVFFSMVLATATNVIGHGSSGDNGTGLTGDPTSGIGPKVPGPTDYGISFLNVADRSALGTKLSMIDRFRMSSPRLGWNDDSGQNGPGSVINSLPWDAPPQAYYMVGGNTSPDYPDLPKNNIVVETRARTSTTGSTAGSGTTITSGSGVLANTSATGATDSRTLNPQPVLVTLSVPKFQPANLESYYTENSGAGILTNGIAHNDASYNDTQRQNFVPHGYVGAARIFVDSNGDGRWSPGEAYRDVQVWTNVQVDMNMVVTEPTTDIGGVPPGFGIQNPSVTAESDKWSPYTASGGGSLLYQPWYRAVHVHNLGNVNLLNLHFDQFLSGTSATGATLSPYLALNSDGNSDDSLIPSIDSLVAGSGDGMLTGQHYTGAIGDTMPIIRSSLDYFVPGMTWTGSAWTGSTSGNQQPFWNTYRPNSALLTGAAPSPYAYPGPTFHKARILDDPSVGSQLTIPDEPHDAGHPLNDPSNGGPSAPQLSVAVPLGTPVGTYYQTLRLFEGHDYPYDIYMGPTYTQQKHEFVVAGGTPQQFFSDPGTELKVTVTESRMTSGSPIRAGAINSGFTPTAALNGIDSDDGPAQLLSGMGGAELTPRSSDIQPTAAPYFVSGSSSPTGLALFWTSGRYDWDSRTDKLASPYDIFGSSVSTTILNGTTALFNSTLVIKPGWGSTINTPSNGQGWWTAPTAITTWGSTGYANGNGAQAYSPYVIKDNSGRIADALVYVNAITTRGATAPSTKYQLQLAPFVNGNVASSTSSVTVSSGTQPIFTPRGVRIGAYYILFWTTRSQGRSVLMYRVYDPNPVSGATPSKDTLLPTPSGLSSVADPTPLGRFIMRSGSSTMSQPNYVDLTYSGKTDGSLGTDIFTSRYQIIEPSGAGADKWTLSLTPISMGASTMLETMTTDQLRQVWHAQDVSWVRDVTRFGVSVGGTVLTLPTPKNDLASGFWIFPAVPMPSAWGGTSDLIVNPFAGTIRFSTAPSAAFNGSVVAMVAPNAIRLTLGGSTNTQPTVFIDTAAKVNSSPSATNSSGIPVLPPVQTARYWYIYRKSGAGSVDPSAVSSTIYFNTRRLTVAIIDGAGNPVRIAIGYPGGPGQPSPVNPPVVTVYDDAAGTNPQDVSSLVDVDWKRGRIYFPEMLEGHYASVQFVPEANAATGTTATFPASGGPALVQWMDEPYVNTPSDPNRYGERTVMLNNAINEGEPSAFLDPAAYILSDGTSPGPGVLGGYASGAMPVNLHRVWLFWSSNRNTYTFHDNFVATTSTANINPGDSAFAIDMTNVNPSALTVGSVLRVDRGANEEDVTITSLTGGIHIAGTFLKGHLAGCAVGNVKLSEFVRASSSGGQIRTYASRVDNPSTPPGNGGEWILYTGGADIYWEALDPRFEIAQ